MTRRLYPRALVFAVGGALALTACSSAADSATSGASGGAGSSGAASGSSSAAAPAGDALTLTFAHTVEVTHPVHRCGAQVFADAVAKASDGSIAIQIFPSGQLGTEAAQADSAIAGDIDITQSSAGHLSTYSERLSVLNAAFLFDDYESMLEVERGEVGQELWADLEGETGLHVLDIFPQGIRQVTTQGVEVRTPADLEGVKMRAADAPIWIANATALGATPTPMALGEVYTGLQQGVIDAQENPVNLISSNSFDEVQDTLALTNHVVQGNPVVINGDRWAELSADQQTILTDAAREASDSLQTCLEDEFTTIVDGWKADGKMKVIQDVDTDAFRAHAVPILLDEFGDVWGDLYDQIRAAQQ